MKKSLLLAAILEIISLLGLGWFLYHFFTPLILWELSSWTSYLVKLIIAMVLLFGAIWCKEWSSSIQPVHRISSWNYAIVSLAVLVGRSRQSAAIYLGSILGYGLMSLVAWRYFKRYYTAFNSSVLSILLFLTSLLKQEYAAELVWQYCILYLLGCSVVWLLYFKLEKSFFYHV